MTHPYSVDKAAADAWGRECAKPGAHFWERVVGPIYAAHYGEQIAPYKNALRKIWLQAGPKLSLTQMIAEPYWWPERPVDENGMVWAPDKNGSVKIQPAVAPGKGAPFTAEWIRSAKEQWQMQQRGIGASDIDDHLANAINGRLATFRPAPASDSDLERMQEALQGAFNNQNNTALNFIQHVGAKYLAAEGFRLGEGIENIDDGGAVERDIQSRIDAAALAERDACVNLVEQLMCGAKKNLDIYANKDTFHEERFRNFIFTFEFVINLLRARTTTPEIATDKATGRDYPPSGTNPSPGTGGDKDPAPSDRDAIFAIIEREFSETGAHINRIIRIHLAHPDIGDVP